MGYTCYVHELRNFQLTSLLDVLVESNINQLQIALLTHGYSYMKKEELLKWRKVVFKNWLYKFV